MKLVTVIALLSSLIVGVNSEFWRETKKAFKSVKEIGRIIGNKKTENIIDSVTHTPFTMTQPIVDIKHSNFDVMTQAEMKKKFEDLGVFSSDSFIESCFNAEKQEKVVMKFYIPDVKAGDNLAAVSVVGIEATKNEDNSVSVKAVDLSARCTVTAAQIIHWRHVVTEFGNNYETKTQEYQSRELTGAEIQTLIDTLTKAIKDDPRYKELPGNYHSHQGVEL